ncbi:MAG TPA: hypothetical protein VH187_13645 [Scandinavium sp.]|jgi:hypothetical protein|uniref:hypothetical protein n=1 Tax=Scandinavium sp. TaxID=2830653 RepID=UPI002E33F6CF|nr:hypothetical protein [Scandinavium sp.]HEX4502175.1 hypothetical protein [Scandinavium sp.]
MTESTTTVEAPATDATAPAADAPEATVETPVTKNWEETITKTLERGQDNLKHKGFIQWISEASNGSAPEMDMDTVIAVQSLYSAWRQTDEFKLIDDEVKAGQGTKPEPTPKTPEEAKAQLEKAVQRQAALVKQAERAAERAARAKELLAQMAAEAEGSGDESTATAEDSEPEAEVAAEESELTEAF